MEKIDPDQESQNLAECSLSEGLSLPNISWTFSDNILEKLILDADANQSQNIIKSNQIYLSARAWKLNERERGAGSGVTIGGASGERKFRPLVRAPSPKKVSFSCTPLQKDGYMLICWGTSP